MLCRAAFSSSRYYRAFVLSVPVLALVDARKYGDSANHAH